MKLQDLMKQTPEGLVAEIVPKSFETWGKWRRNLYLKLIAWFSGYDKLVELLIELKGKQGRDYIEDFFEKLDFSYAVAHKDREKIPSEGRLLVVANHPLGALDGLSLLMAVTEVRPDVRIVVGNFLTGIDELSEFFIPVDKDFDIAKSRLKPIAAALANEEAVILFPSRSVSRLRWAGLRDRKWRSNLVALARRMNTPVLPVYIKARNSWRFYLKALFSERLASLSLPREILRQRGKTIGLKIGHQIPATAFSALKSGTAMKLLHRHVLAIGREKKGYFKTEKNVIHPVDRRQIRAELSNARLLGSTDDGMNIYLTDYSQSPATVREIARLRELTFRKVGEGTGHKLDSDLYDRYYNHLVLWDDTALEIVGAYRIGECAAITAQRGTEGLYTATLFTFDDKFKAMFPESIELGRSFVQQKYWNSNALDYLWHGIGAYLANNPQIRYMFGPVSISKMYSKEAIEMLVHFYSKWFPDYENLAAHKTPFLIPDKRRDELRELFNSLDFKTDFKTLKANLKHYGFAVPTLYKQYSDLCEEGGVRFLDFGIDEDFGYCVDGMILVDIARIKQSKYDRYIAGKKIEQQTTTAQT